MKRFSYIMAAAILALPTQAHVWDELAILARPDQNGGFELERYSFIQPSAYTNAIFLDYNNDNQLDLLIMGSGADWNLSSKVKFVLLYRNLGPEENYRFENVPDTGLPQACDATYLNPIAAGDFNHDGYTDLLLMTTAGQTPKVELFLNNSGTGKFTRSEIQLEGAASGSVTMGDVDNDGWPDILYTGKSTSGTPVLKIYRNNRDGSVSDITPADIKGSFRGQATLADLNGNGRLDIVSCGQGADGKALTGIWTNAGAPDGTPAWSPADAGLTNLHYATPLAADFNADGFMDLILNGSPTGSEQYCTRIYYGNASGTFMLDESYPVVAVNREGGINMGDWNGDGNMDLIVGGYIGTNFDGVNRYGTPLRVYENRPADKGLSGNSFPSAPASVSAEYTDGLIHIRWSAGNDSETPVAALRYNILVKNETTGEIYNLIPADTATGKLKVGTDLQTSLSSAVSEYAIAPLGSGDYTIGVQTLDQSFAGSTFTTCSLRGIEAGIDAVTTDGSINPAARVQTDGLRLSVEADADTLYQVFGIDGTLITHEYSSSDTLLPGAGIYVVSFIAGGSVHSVKVAAR